MYIWQRCDIGCRRGAVGKFNFRASKHKKLWLKFRKPRYLKSKRDEICNRSNKFKLLEKYISFVVVVVLIFSH
ncbi:hypothetical protein CCS77_0117 [Campylobacter concisus]|uniref:Uncharacterized protein n=1 Tax=Campylobacter concisus TaxID=199 RepID=A0A2R4NXN6_9BACT|nr:hypothetical protein CCS77_0117 [Campylobacter concisus]